MWAIIAAAAIAGVALLRLRRYGRRFNYNPEQDCIAGFCGPEVEILGIRCNDRGFILPANAHSGVSALLELEVRATGAGKHLDPGLEIDGGGMSDLQAVERCTNGKRFFNLSRFLTPAGADSEIRLRGRHLKWSPGPAKIHLCRDRLTSGDRVLVVAPHPDDAEISAFGVYADTDSTVVTVTAGDGSDRYRCSRLAALSLSRQAIAKARVLDSISIPRLGGVAPANAVNLCYPDGSLTDMQTGRLHDTGLDFEGLRGLSDQALVREGAECSWGSLVADLIHILGVVKPSVIVTPHPDLETHPDHGAATRAVMQALRATDASTGRFFFYCVHFHRSELWPLGQAGTGVTLMPLLPGDAPGGTGFYSHRLSPQRQMEKFLALEAMHDIRQIEWPQVGAWDGTGKRLLDDARGILDGIGRAPTSYLRRAVRPDEIFFVMPFETALRTFNGAAGNPAAREA